MQDEPSAGAAADDAMIEELVGLVEAAGEAILRIYETDFDVQTKSDESPLTQADLASHRVLAEGLQRLAPELPLFSEEADLPPFEQRRRWQRYWLVDPLDGTKEFINRNGEFTVNVALIDGQRPVVGVVGVPVRKQVYVGVEGRGAWRFDRRGAQQTRVTLSGRARRDDAPLVVVASRSHGGERLEHYLGSLESAFGRVVRTPVGSSLKLCILAEGEADLYPRLGPTSEWDIAAAHAVLAAAGGDVWAVDGSPLTYNSKDSVLNPEFFAAADGRYPWRARLPAVPR
ncbi:MAG TPA: 3'(2'),5'-bisphosphate nucleotidase CysQ [Pseudomonadales bacterium]